VGRPSHDAPDTVLARRFLGLIVSEWRDHAGYIQNGLKALVRQSTFAYPMMPLKRFPAARPIAGLVRIFYPTNAFDADGKGFL
jgi:hypothetical protein